MRLLVCRIFAKRETGDRYFNFRMRQSGMRNTVIIAMYDRILRSTLGTQCATTCKEKFVSLIKIFFCVLNGRFLIYLFEICCCENYINTTKSELCNAQEKIDQLPIFFNTANSSLEDILFLLQKYLPCKIAVRNKSGWPCLASSFHYISIVHKMISFSLFHDCSTFDLIKL